MHRLFDFSAFYRYHLLNGRRQLPSALGLLLVLLWVATSQAQPFALTGSMFSKRGYHASVSLPDGTVMVSGGNAGSFRTAGIELYDPASRRFNFPAFSMQIARSLHTATLLLDGRVLFTGGRSNDEVNGNNRLRSAEVCNLSTGCTYTGNMASLRNSHTATLLLDGRVLITGGTNGTNNLSSAELFNPNTGTFAPTGNMTLIRTLHTATRLNDGRVLIVGGASDSGGARASAEVFDPATGTFTRLGSMSAPRYWHTATLLQSGHVLVTGGANSTSRLSSAELFDPSAGTFSTVGGMSVNREDHTATLLKNGRVLVTGGRDDRLKGTSSADLYDPAAMVFRSLPAMKAPRECHRADLLPSGQVLLTGGYVLVEDNNATNTAEIYTPAPEPPSIYEVSPRQGVVGAQITISGGNFSNATQVSLHGTSAAFQIVSHNKIVMTVPAGATTGLIKVTNPDGSATFGGEFVVFSSDSSGAIVSEFRFRGASGTTDEFVEIYNKLGAPLNVSGWRIDTNKQGNIQSTLVPLNTTIPVRGRFLFGGSGYTLGGYGKVDQSILGDMDDNSGVALFNAAGEVQDAIGFGTSPQSLREGAGLPSAPTVNGQYSFVREFSGTLPKDSGDSSNDFVFVLADADAANPAALATIAGTNGDVTARLGAPSPEGLASPYYHNLLVAVGMLDPSVAQGAVPNRERVNYVPGGALGELLIRRTITNTTGKSLSRLRFTMASITSLGTPGPATQADVRLVSSSDETVTLADGTTTVFAKGLTMESNAAGLPFLPLEGGLGSSALFTDAEITPLAPGETRAYVARLLIKKSGNFSILLNIHAVPVP